MCNATFFVSIEWLQMAQKMARGLCGYFFWFTTVIYARMVADSHGVPTSFEGGGVTAAAVLLQPVTISPHPVAAHCRVSGAIGSRRSGREVAIPRGCVQLKCFPKNLEVSEGIGFWSAWRIEGHMNSHRFPSPKKPTNCTAL